MSIKVLVACEASQKITCAFRALGIEAYSCDIQDTYGSHPEWHIKGDCLYYINSGWDLVIAHPPCTYLSKCQGNLIFDKDHNVVDQIRYANGMLAADFFRKCLSCTAPFLCVENPRPLNCWGLPKPDCCIQPYEFGHPYTKLTCLWLKRLPPLMPTDIIYPHVCRQWIYSFPGFSKNTKYKQSRLHSETFQGIANAFATQYGSFVTAALSK